MPGRTGIHQSDFAAVSDRCGSIVTIRAPRLRASNWTFQKWMFVTAVFEPQLTMYRALTAASGSIIARVPRVTSQPAAPAVAQMVRSSRLAPSRWKNRRSRLAYISLPIVPA